MSKLVHSIWFNNLLRQIYRSLPFSPHIKHWLKEIYLCRPNTWKLGGKGTRFIDGNRDALALAATNASQFDSDEPWILVIAPALFPEPDSNSHSVWPILRLLGELKLRITFISDSENCSPPYQKILEKQCIHVLNGFDVGRSHLTEAGGKYHFVLLFGTKAAFRHLPYVRAYAPYSKVIYQMAGPQLDKVSTNSTLSAKFSELRRLELFNAACADLMLVDEEEKDSLFAAQSDAKVIVLPSLATNYYDSGVKKRWVSIFDTSKDKLSRVNIQG
jgi:hypothetical protein